MKRKIIYDSVDGQSFPSRFACHMHELNIVRERKIEEFLNTKLSLKPGEKADMHAVTAKIVEHAVEFAELLSARATRKLINRAGGVSNAMKPGAQPMMRRRRAAALQQTGT